MNLHESLLFIHLIAVTGYFMLFGIEWYVVHLVSNVERQTESGLELTYLRHILTPSQIALLCILISGGPLVQSVSPGERPGFAVTLGMFIVLAAITGISARSYRSISSPHKPPWRLYGQSIATRATLIAAILFLVSAKPSLVVSLAVFGISAVCGILVSLFVVPQLPTLKRS
jgi:hypothetical protein